MADRTIFILGASRGIGKACALLLAQADIAAGRVRQVGDRTPTLLAYWLIAPLPQWRQKKVKALVEALTAYSGAVILVSHDMHLLGMVADRLWLVKDGTVRPYEDDLDAYRAMLLTQDKPGRADREKPVVKAPKPSRDEILALRSDHPASCSCCRSSPGALLASACCAGASNVM